ncbi:MAG: MCE family protein [Proteobacteria bacterium]|nr:MCE family protein [Pseudomonadota bacterium]MBU1451140.1 MCE family protein [Pseudomonadota bacterium]MBU2467441.1 MCE family protein [Pseudomonadota bacterium]MBU2516980.1 MCE family protein [Pseudomonadota bacterium]
MSTHASNFKVGLFVLLGLALGVGAIAWLGASQYLKGAEKYVTFFNESVQGLQNDSTVRYRGVDVGRVKAIRVAPDSRLIEVIMEIQFEGDLSKELVAQLSTAGITGITFIELDRKKPGEKDLSPKIDFVAEYPIIPSRPSELQRIVSTLDNVMQQVQTINFKQMGQRLEKTLESVEKLFTDQRLQVTMERIADASVKVDELARRIDRALDEKSMKTLVADSKKVLDGAKATVASAKGMVDQLSADIKEMELGATGKRAGRLFEGLEQRSYQLALEAQLTMQNLREASENLKELLQNLERDPSNLIFSRPPATPPHQEGR